MSQQKIYVKRKIYLEHKCVLQESWKTMRRWQISIQHVRGGHCVGNCYFRFLLVNKFKKKQHMDNLCYNFIYSTFFSTLVNSMRNTRFADKNRGEVMLIAHYMNVYVYV